MRSPGATFVDTTAFLPTCKPHKNSTAGRRRQARPHPLAYLGGLLWMASWDTNHIYAIDPKSWNVRHELRRPASLLGKRTR